MLVLHHKSDMVADCAALSLRLACRDLKHDVMESLSFCTSDRDRVGWQSIVTNVVWYGTGEMSCNRCLMVDPTRRIALSSPSIAHRLG